MAQAPAQTPAPNRPSLPIALGDLLLDPANPRFGDVADLKEQTAILDHIVKSYGVDDVLSSLSVNGYFKAEPLVGRRDGTKITIIEGNRRLAACLILAGDSRARNQGTKTSQYGVLWEQHGRPNIDPVPVICFEPTDSQAELLSYLGVRHISASTPWDSYAKANWAAKVVRTTSLTVTDISTMIGDPHRTVARLLDGYYVVRQAIAEGIFNPTDCVRRGRGSVTEYPFSWVYTILGYAAARQFLGMPDSGPRENPIPRELLPRVQFVLIAMFGSQSRGLNAVIRDSRALGDLAAALLDEEKVNLLAKGIALDEVIRVTRPANERITDNLAEVARLQSEIVGVLAAEPITLELAQRHHPSAIVNRRTSTNIEKAFRDVLYPEDTDA